MSDEAIDFFGDYDGYIKYAEENETGTPQWCVRHWAPAPVEGLSGATATVKILGKTLEMMPDEIMQMEDKSAQADAANKWMAEQEQPICCQLGDDVVTALWLEVAVEMGVVGGPNEKSNGDKSG